MNKIEIKFDKLLTNDDPIIGPPIVCNLDNDTKKWSDICDHLSQWDIFPERYPALSNIKLPSLPKSMIENSASASLNLTHAAISRHCFINTNKLLWLVLEDDCRFLKNPKEVILETLVTAQQNNIDWSIISLGCFSFDYQAKKPDLSYDKFVLNQPVNWYPWGTHSCLVNRKYALELASIWSLCINPVDHLLLHEYSNKRGFLRRPSITYQEEYSYPDGGAPDRIKSADLHPDTIKNILESR